LALDPLECTERGRICPVRGARGLQAIWIPWADFQRVDFRDRSVLKIVMGVG
jgi:hypothetical protein